MTEEEKPQSNIPEIIEGDLSGPLGPVEDTADVINVDNPPETEEEFTGENFDALLIIYKLLNSPEDSVRVEINYGQIEEETKTATVLVDGKQYYFTESAREIENFHNWEQNKKKREERKVKKSN